MMEKMALLRAASFISSLVMFSSFPRLKAAAMKITGCSRTIRIVSPQRTAINGLLASFRCVIPPKISRSGKMDTDRSIWVDRYPKQSYTDYMKIGEF